MRDGGYWNWDGFIGQNRAKQLIIAAIQFPDKHILIRGPYGHGKTVLATIVAHNLTTRYNFEVAHPGMNLNWYKRQRGKVYVIDEVHELPHPESWYPLLDAGRNRFIFTTTDTGELPAPFVSRMLEIVLEPYTEEEIKKIVLDYVRPLLGTNGFPKDIYVSTIEEISKRSKQIPRVAKRIADIILGTAKARGIVGIIPQDFALTVLEDILQLSPEGFDPLDRQYLQILRQHGPIGLANIAGMMLLDKSTIQRQIEPFLLRKGYICITPRGRKLADEYAGY